MADMKEIQAYQSALSQARNMLDKGIIDIADIVLIENKLPQQSSGEEKVFECG